MLYNIEVNGNFLSKDNILSKVSDYNIYSYYLGFNIELGKVYSSPLRTDDTNPSFGFYKARNGSIMFKDLAKPDICGDCFKFVKELLNKRTYKETILDIYINLVLNNKSSNYKYIIPAKKRKTIGIRRTKFSKTDLEYWAKYNITEEILKKFNVFKAAEVFVNDVSVKISTSDNPIYAYKIFNSFKIYNPLETNKKYKWLSDCSSYDISGFEQLPETGDLLIISKATKDVMLLHSLGIPAIAPCAETINIPENVINILKSRFKNIIIFYDNDIPGIEAAKKLSDKYKLSYIHLPQEGNFKDITDYCKEKGIESTCVMLASISVDAYTKLYVTQKES